MDKFALTLGLAAAVSSAQSRAENPQPTHFGDQKYSETSPVRPGKSAITGPMTTNSPLTPSQVADQYGIANATFTTGTPSTEHCEGPQCPPSRDVDNHWSEFPVPPPNGWNVYSGEYKGVRVMIEGAPREFYYIRSDHLQRLAGGLATVISSGVFGPFPKGAVIKVRKGAVYAALFSCPPVLKRFDFPVSDDALQGNLDLSCQ